MLREAMQAHDAHIEFDLLEDLKTLQRHQGILKARDFARELEQLVVKYSVTESAVVHKGLVGRCTTGDVNAIKLYNELYGGDTDNSAAIANFLAATQPSDADIKKMFAEVNGDGQTA